MREKKGICHSTDFIWWPMFDSVVDAQQYPNKNNLMKKFHVDMMFSASWQNKYLEPWNYPVGSHGPNNNTLSVVSLQHCHHTFLS